MNRRNLLAVYKQLTEAGGTATDAELLARFVASREEAAFAALVQRHGRLVWAVCRNLAGEDADDAFQATFLTLLRNAGKVRKANSLAAWLHGVAYRVCSKARQSAKRRAGRERAVAVSDRATAVPDSAWDRALAAIHEEVVKLPETQRVPFVLCCLEGKSVTEAAGELGWKLGTLSARLTRAKDALLARLNAREYLAGAGAMAALAGSDAPAPAAVLAKATGLVQAGVTVPSSILQLSQGVIGMSIYQVKLLAAGVLVACGMGLGGGAGWLANADAQFAEPPTTRPAGGTSADDKVRLLQAQLDQAVKERDRAKQLNSKRYAEVFGADAPPMEMTSYPTERWVYGYVKVSPMKGSQFTKFLQFQEEEGWAFVSQVTLREEGQDAPMWVFRKPIAKPRGIYAEYPAIDVQGTTPAPARGDIPPASTAPPSPPTAPPAYPSAPAGRGALPPLTSTNPLIPKPPAPPASTGNGGDMR